MMKTTNKYSHLSPSPLSLSALSLVSLWSLTAYTDVALGRSNGVSLIGAFQLVCCAVRFVRSIASLSGDLVLESLIKKSKL